MAGDWIKMRSNLRSHPKVVRIASALKADKLRVVGGLHAVWCLFDEHSEDGQLLGYTPSALDEEIGFHGFSDLMTAVGWLESDGNDCLRLPEFDTHNGASAKRRAQESDRKRIERAAAKVGEQSVPIPSARDADKKRTREEKRREEEKEKEKDPPASRVPRATRKCPDDFVLTSEMREWAINESPGVDIERETAKFRDYTFKASRSDWPATWKNWIREAFDRRPKAAGETDYQRSRRLRVAEACPAIAIKPPGSLPQLNPMDVLDGLTRIAG